MAKGIGLLEVLLCEDEVQERGFSCPVVGARDRDPGACFELVAGGTAEAPISCAGASRMGCPARDLEA